MDAIIEFVVLLSVIIIVTARIRGLKTQSNDEESQG